MVTILQQLLTHIPTFVSCKCVSISAEKTVHVHRFYIQTKVPEQHCAEWESSKNVRSGMGNGMGTNVFF